ncbi:lonely Cys domain-containing protein [Streptomyces sp. NBC_00654]|uniref:lonely Cys domain-containing protein n=1 Tax=Streptomyces sp. NBC_00654 TaxID=2975799 RepID=UPI00225626E1|nr:lonely Cys domain-containing protein [Streptomyces sp. NBC_00654]MCX4966939.1 lonely Cys domain-containing protein [Streptomyces sp. NBC_00654]
MIPDSIEFPEAARYILFILLGELPLQASSDMAFSSAVPYDDKAAQVLDLRGEVIDLLNKVDGAVPPRVAESFKEALAPLTGAGGSDVLGDLAEQIRQVSDNRTKQSQKIMESKFEIVAEALILLAELALIAALSFFTGGLSFSQTATAKARSTVAILTIMQRLLNQTHLLPALSEAVQEALTTLAVRLAMLTLNEGRRRPDGIDGRDILKSLAVGGLAGFFGSFVSKGLGDIFKNQFRNFGDNKWGVLGGNVFRNAAGEGPSEGLAEFLVNGLFDNRWKFDVMSMAGGSLSAVVEMFLSDALNHITKGLNSKLFDGRNVFSPYNPPPGPDNLLGGGGDVVVHTPAPTPNTLTTSSSGPAPEVTTSRPPPGSTTPPPVHTPVPPVVPATPAPVNTLLPTLPDDALDPFRADSPLPGGDSPYTATGRDASRTMPAVTGPLHLPTRTSAPPLSTASPGTTTPLGTGVPVLHMAPVTTPVSAPGADRAVTAPVSAPAAPVTASPVAGGRPESQAPQAAPRDTEAATQPDTDPEHFPDRHPAPGSSLTAPDRSPGETPDTTRRTGTGADGRQASDSSPQENPVQGSDGAPVAAPLTHQPPATDPVRPEQWRHRQEAAPAGVVHTGTPGAPPADGTGAPTGNSEPATTGTEVRRVQADDGRWVRSLSLDIPVRPGPGLAGVDLDDLQERVRVLLDTEVNHGLLLPRSGDQLHVDLSVLVAPDATRAVELSATDRPALSDQQHIRLYGDDPGLSPSDRERRRADNAVTVLRRLLRHAGLSPIAGPGTGPLVTPEALRTVESVTDAVPLTAPDAPAPPGPDTVPSAVRPSLESDGPGLGPGRPHATASEFPDRPRPLVTALALPPAAAPDADSDSDSGSDSDSDSDLEREPGHSSAPGPHTAPTPRSAGLILKPHPDYMLNVGAAVGSLLYAMGFPAVLAGDARGRVQFGNPRPLLTVDFQLVATGLPAADDIRRELERLPGETVVSLPDQNLAGTVILLVNGVEIRITTGTAPAGFDTAPGFTLPSPADSLSDAALTLATAPTRAVREEALFDLLWALSRTPAHGPRAAALIGAREDAYRTGAPPGAAPTLAVQLSEILDAALDPDTLHQHEGLWADNEASEDDEPRLEDELAALAAELRAMPEVVADPVRALAARLPGMSPAELTFAIADVTPDHRERLAAGPALVDALRDSLTPADFATAAAHLIVQVPTGVHEPGAVRRTARTQVARALHDPVVTARMVKRGSRVVVVPRDRAVTSLEAFHDLKHQVNSDGRCYHTIRGVATLHAAISEENLLGEHTTIGHTKSLPDGYSATFHEVSHIVHRVGLDYQDLGLIDKSYEATRRSGEAGAWPDCALYSYDEKTGRRSRPNYSSTNQYEFFAQLTNVYLRANTGNDPVTGLPRENGGPEWVKEKHPTLYHLMRRLYGPGPKHRLRVNPVEATQAQNEGLARARILLGDGDDAPATDTGPVSDPDSDSASESEPDHTFAATTAPRAEMYPPLALPTQSAEPTGEDREFTSVDGVRLRESEIEAGPLPDDLGEPLGHATTAPTPQAHRRRQRLRRFRHLGELVHLVPAADSGGFQDGPGEPVATPPAALTLYAGHGEPGRLLVELKDGRTLWLDKIEAVRYIGGLPEVRALPPGGRIHLEVCWSATDGDPGQHYPMHAELPYSDDLLDETSLGLLLANLTGMGVDAATRPTGLNDDTRFMLSSARGVRGRRVLFLPEPDLPQLDRSARSGGLHTDPGPVPEATRHTTLRLVRALRLEYGCEESDPALDDRLWRGITALERLRAADPRLSGVTPLRTDMWDFATEQHTGRPADREGRTALLDHARAVLAADPAADFGTAVPSRVLDATLNMLAADGEPLSRYAHALPSDAAPTSRQWASTLWAAARSAQRLFSDPPEERREALGRRILRLAPGTEWNRDRQQEVWALVTRAATQGVDIGDTDTLAAYHLADGGLFGPMDRLNGTSPAGGVNWSDAPAPFGVAWQSPRQIVPGPAGTSPRPAPAPWIGSGRPYPRIYLVGACRRGLIGLRLPGGTQVLLSESEFLALLDFDPVLRTLPLKNPALFFATDPAAPLPAGFARRFADRTGRPAHTAAGPMTLTGPADAPRTLLLMPGRLPGGRAGWESGHRGPAAGAAHYQVSLFAPDTAGTAGPAEEAARQVKEITARLSRSIERNTLQTASDRNVLAPGTWWPEQWMVEGSARLRKTLDRRVMRGEAFGEQDLADIMQLSELAPRWLNEVGIGTYEEAEEYTGGPFRNWLELSAGRRVLTATLAVRRNHPVLRAPGTRTPTDPAYTLGRFMLTQAPIAAPDERRSLERERDQQIRDTAVDTLHPEGMAASRRHGDAVPAEGTPLGESGRKAPDYVGKDAQGREMLTRILLLLRHGLQLYSPQEGRHVTDHGQDVIRALAHGGRVNVRIPALRSADEAAYWLPHFLGATKDDTKAEVAEFVSERGFATHRTAIGANKGDRPGTFEEKGGARASVTNMLSVGSARPQLWGQDISGGGLGAKDWNGDMVLPNGSYGHVLLVHHRPTLEKDGSLQIGVETIAPHAASPVGYRHDFRSTEATSNPESVLHGHKRDKIGSGGLGRNERYVDLKAMGASHPSGDWRVCLDEIKQDWNQALIRADDVSGGRRALYEELVGERARSLPVPSAAPGTLLRTDDGGAVLDGVGYALHPVPGGPGRTAEAIVLTALGDHPALAGPLPAAEPDRSVAFRAWLADALSDGLLTDDQVPPLDRSATVTMPQLERAGHDLTGTQRAQGILLGNLLPAADIATGPAVRLRLLLADPGLGGPGTELPLLTLLTATVHALGVTAAVAEEDRTVVLYGSAPNPPVDRPYVLLLRDGDEWLTGLPGPPGPGRPPSPPPAREPQQVLDHRPRHPPRNP